MGIRPLGTRAPGARSPEELDRLLEDAVVLRDPAALAGLYAASGVLVVGTTRAGGRPEIVRAAPRLWNDGFGYVADAGRVETAGDLALVLGGGSAHVARRARDGTWRLVITVLDPRVVGAG